MAQTPHVSSLTQRMQGQRLTKAERIAAQVTFLEAFKICGNVRTSCLAANIKPKTAYEWLKKDSEFAALFEEAETEAVDFLESKAFEFGVDGIEKPVIARGEVIYQVDKDGEYLTDKDGKRIMETYREPNVQLLMFLLKARKPEMYRERPPKVEVNNNVTVTEHKERLLDKLRALPEPTVVDADVRSETEQNATNPGEMEGEEDG